MKHMEKKKAPPILSIVGASGSGKTTLLEKLIPELRSRGFRIGTIKHDVHNFQMDRTGKDSWRHKQAGATVTILSSPHQIGMVMDVDHDHPVEELTRFFTNVDLILTEGYKRGKTPKVEVFRAAVCDAPLCRGDKSLLALISEESLEIGVPRFSPHHPGELADFLTDALHISPSVDGGAHSPSR
jgi:molybdopterin-guanine dinucleotide biosynthesis protein B